MTDPIPPGLRGHWDKPLREFVTLDPAPVDPALGERHRIYSLLTLALLAAQWNGNKWRTPGDYGTWRTSQLAEGEAGRLGYYATGDYQGHNIAALAVDARGRVIDFDFNHNELFNSSVEHAESRLMRRLFSLAQVFESWDDATGMAERVRGPEPAFLLAVSAPPEEVARSASFAAPLPGGATASASAGGAARSAARRTSYGKLLTDVTIYTSLESCAQCSGIMTLGDVREVVYMQHDPGQYFIGNMMFQATKGGSGARAPRPVPAGGFGFEYFDRLQVAFDEFRDRVRVEPFFTDAGGRKDHGGSITSFLCTDLARTIVDDAATELRKTRDLAAPDYTRPGRDGTSVPGALTNRQVLAEATGFLRYAAVQGGRGTAHRA